MWVANTSNDLHSAKQQELTFYIWNIVQWSSEIHSREFVSDPWRLRTHDLFIIFSLFWHKMSASLFWLKSRSVHFVCFWNVRRLFSSCNYCLFTCCCLFSISIYLFVHCLFAVASSLLAESRCPQPALTAALLHVCCSSRCCCCCCSAAVAALQFHSKGFLTSQNKISLPLLAVFQGWSDI